MTEVDPSRVFSPLRRHMVLSDLEARIIADIKRVRVICLRGSAVHVYERGRGYRWGKAAHIAERVGTSPSAVGQALWRLKTKLRNGVPVTTPGRIYHQPDTDTFWYLFTLAEEQSMVGISAQAETDRVSDSWEKA